MFAMMSGLRALFTDTHEFVAAIRFVRPAVFPLLCVPLILGIISWFITRRQQRQALALGRAAFPRPTRGRFAFGIAWIIAVVALAGPRWGQTADAGVAVGRDVMIALDFSRSMWAEDMIAGGTPSRWQASVASVQELLADFHDRRTGHRVGVVIFAARPKLLVPLTTDFEHLRFRLGELDATTPPTDIRPLDDKAISGTRLGAAIKLAVDSHDSRYPGVQDVILLTDADDPGDDREWSVGVSAARAATIPIHVVGVGDPNQDTFILRRGNPLEAIGPNGVPTPIQTRLHEATAKQLATEARGEYVAAARTTPDLRTWFRTIVEAGKTREVSDDRLPQLRDRTAWFIAFALGFFVLASIRSATL